jgi:hypothetical protein
VLGARDEEHPVVAAIRDQQVARERSWWRELWRVLDDRSRARTGQAVPPVPGHADSGDEGDEQKGEDRVAALCAALLPLRGAAVDRHPEGT